MVSALLAGIALTPLTFRLAAADITPPEPLALGGYTARGGKLCELPGERIEAKTLLLEQAKLRVAIVSCDLLTIPESLRDEVSLRIPKDIQLFLVATHTHCAPDSQMLNRRMDFSIPGIARFDQKWLSWFAVRISDSVRSALKQPAQTMSVANVAIGRRNLNRARRPYATPDTLAIRLLDTERQPLLTHYAAHAVLYGSERNAPSPDFPGQIRGPGVFLPGAIGDMSPASKGSTPRAQVENFGKEFNEGRWTIEAWPAAPLDFASVPLEGATISPNNEFARLNRIPEAFARSIVTRFAPESGNLTLVRIGKLAIVGVPGEPTAEIGRRIRSAGLGLGFNAVLTVSHCNGWMGYILEPQDYDRGGYEASLAFHGRELGDSVVRHATIGLQMLRKSKN